MRGSVSMRAGLTVGALVGTLEGTRLVLGWPSAAPAGLLAPVLDGAVGAACGAVMGALLGDRGVAWVTAGFAALLLGPNVVAAFAQERWLVGVVTVLFSGWCALFSGSLAPRLAEIAPRVLWLLCVPVLAMLPPDPAPAPHTAWLCLVDGVPTLRERGTVFTQVVAPSLWIPATVTTAVTGLHPLRHQRIGPGDRIRPGTETLADWVHGAVLIDFDGCLDGPGLSDSFVYLGPTWYGFERLAMLAWLHPPAWTAERVHVASDAVAGAPLVVVHSPAECAVIGIGPRVVVSLGGAGALGDAGPVGSMSVSGAERGVGRVGAAVRVADVAPTLLGLMGLREDTVLEGVDLQDWRRGTATASMATSIIDPFGPAFAFRTADATYVVGPDGTESLLRNGVAGSEDVALENPALLIEARRISSAERAAFDRWVREH